jgi:hypothetical protein
VQHPLFQDAGQFRVATFEQHAHIAHGFLIFFGSAQSLDAWTETAFDVIFQTRARRLAIDFNVAGAQLKRAVNQINCAAGHCRGQERPEIKGAIVLNAPGDYTFRKWLVDSQLQMRIRLIVF